ncbi:MAG: NB-ARC domain-containing protein [Cyanobacteriota bacterium]|nr:NB-ARC domain-containing protein [Cyanobacteriota bacterium]
MEFQPLLEGTDEIVFHKVGRRLTPVEVATLRGSYNRQTYDQIAQESNYSPNYLKFDVAPKLWKLLSEVFGESVTKTNLQAVLERQWRRQHPQQRGSLKRLEPTQSITDDAPPQGENLRLPPCVTPTLPAPNIDWGEAPDVTIFYGRTDEQKILSQWLLDDRCSLIALLGMGGMGKSSLAAKITHSCQTHFDGVIWRSLRNAPPLETLLSEWVGFLSQQQETQAKPERLLHWLRTRRCLVILDNLESILQAGDRVGFYQHGYEGYGELLRLVGESQHQSCLLLTSREKPTEISTFETIDSKVRSLSLSGSWEASLALIESKELKGSDNEKRQLCEFYNGNPLALKIVAASIQSLFEGEIALFLAEETMVFNGLRRLLEQQFGRLSESEQTIMYWLAINREWTSLADLVQDIVPSVSKADLLEGLESLTWRSLVERRVPSNEKKLLSQYTQQPVVMEYVTHHLIQQISHELTVLNLSLFCRYALVKNTVLEYVRQSQIRLILSSVATHVRGAFRNNEHLQQHFQRALQVVRNRQMPFFDYSVGNLINLCVNLDLDLSVYDFSGLKIRQVNFQSHHFAHVNLADTELKDCRFTQTFGGIVATAFSPSAQTLVLGDSNGSIRLWQIADSSDHRLVLGYPLRDFIGHTSWVLSLSWHPDGQRLVSGSGDYLLKLWDAQTGQCLSTLPGHQQTVWWVAWSPDGTQIASASGDHTIKIWDGATGTCLNTLHGHQNLVYCVAWSPDGKTLASGSEDSTVRLWDPSTGECLKTLTVGGFWVRQVAWSPDGGVVASASTHVTLWDSKTGQPLRTWVGHSLWSDALAWSPDGQMLATSGSDRQIKLWDPWTGDCLYTLSGHRDLIWALNWARDSKTLVSGSYDQTVRLWDAKTGQCSEVLQGYTNLIRSIAWSPDGQSLTSSSTDNTIRIWDVATGQCRQTLTGHQAWIYSVAWSPCAVSALPPARSEMIASGSGDATIKLWDVSTGQCMRTLYGHTSWVWSVDWIPGGHKLASSGSVNNDLTARIWNVQTGECLRILAGHKSWIWWIKWSPDGNLLATASDDQTIKLWDGNTGECLKTLFDDRQLGLAISWSPDSQYLATSALNNVVRIWNVTTGSWEQELSGHQAIIWAIAWSPNNQWIASASDDGTIRIWDLSGLECCHILRGHESRMWDLAWSPDGFTLASSSLDATIRLWDARTGTCVKVLRSDRPYEGMNITGMIGVTTAQVLTLQALGAITGG